MALWYEEERGKKKNKIKPPAIAPEPWDNGSFTPEQIVDDELDYTVRGGAGALETVQQTLEAAYGYLGDMGEGFMEGLETGGLYLSVEGAALRHAMLMSADTSGEKVVSPEQAKEEFDIDVDRPVSMREAFVRQMLKEDYEKQLADWKEDAIQIERPHVTAATWAGTAAALWAMPSTRLASGLIRKSLVAGGTAIANAAMMHAAAKLGGNASNLKLSTQMLAGLAKPVNTLDKWARKLSTTQRDIATIAAVEGSANALEALGAQALEKKLGNEYDITGELALGYAAPAIFGAAARAMRGAHGAADTVGEYAQFSKAIDENLTKATKGQSAFKWAQLPSAAERKLLTATPEPVLLPPAAKLSAAEQSYAGATKEMNELTDAITNGYQLPPKQLKAKLYDQLRTAAGAPPKHTRVLGDEDIFSEVAKDPQFKTDALELEQVMKGGKEAVREPQKTLGDEDIYAMFRDDPAMQAELDKLDALVALEEVYGAGIVDDLNDLRVTITKTGFETNIEDMHPWLRSPAAVKQRVNEVGADKPAKALFDMTAEQADDFIAKNQTPEPNLKMIKEVQQKPAAEQPTVTIKEQLDEAAVLEQVNHTTNSRLQETANDLTFKDPKTGKLLKFPKDKIKKLKAGDTDSLETTTKSADKQLEEEFEDVLGREQGDQVMVQDADTGEVYKVSEDFANEMNDYAKEFDAFPELQRIDKVGFQEGLAKADDDLDAAFADFQKCLKGGGE